MIECCISFIAGSLFVYLLFARAYHRYNSQYEELIDKAKKYRDQYSMESQAVSKLETEIKQLKPHNLRMARKLLDAVGINLAKEMGPYLREADYFDWKYTKIADLFWGEWKENERI